MEEQGRQFEDSLKGRVNKGELRLGSHGKERRLYYCVSVSQYWECFQQVNNFFAECFSPTLNTSGVLVTPTEFLIILCCSDSVCFEKCACVCDRVFVRIFVSVCVLYYYYYFFFYVCVRMVEQCTFWADVYVSFMLSCSLCV